MLIEILECMECGRRLVNIDGKSVKAHRCSGSVKVMADAEVSVFKLREAVAVPPEAPSAPEPPSHPTETCDCDRCSEEDEKRHFAGSLSGAEPSAREPHDGWLNEWIYKNVPRNKNAGYLWNDDTRKMAGDWADFRVASLSAVEERTREIAELNLADYARRFYSLFDMYRTAWLREMGGVIVPKHHQIDGFVLRARSIYEKAQLVDRIKRIMVAELKNKSTAEQLFDAVFKMLAENGKDKVPTN